MTAPPYRQVFFMEIVPDHWVSVSMKGEFDSDIWHALKSFVDRHATRPAEQEAECADVVRALSADESAPEGK